MTEKALRGLTCLAVGLVGGVVVVSTSGLGLFGFIFSNAAGIIGFLEVQKREYGRTTEKRDCESRREKNCSPVLPNARGDFRNEAYFNRNRRG